jgi:putative oxidoreductase
MTQPVSPGVQRAERPARRRGANIALWILQGLLGLSFVLVGVTKLAGAEQAVQLFDDIGAGQWFRYVVGALELAGGIGLLVPRLAGLAGLGLAGVMLGAVGTHIFIIGGTFAVPLILAALSALVAWGRWDRTRALVDRIRGRSTASGLPTAS